MRTHTILWSILILYSGFAFAAEECVWKTLPVSTAAKPVSMQAVRNLPANLTLEDIVQRLGPAVRDVGSGVHILQWEISNGQVFSVSAPGPCASPVKRTIHASKTAPNL